MNDDLPRCRYCHQHIHTHNKTQMIHCIENEPAFTTNEKKAMINLINSAMRNNSAFHNVVRWFADHYLFKPLASKEVKE